MEAGNSWAGGGGGSPASSDFIPGKTVANFAALPPAADNSGLLAICLNSQGVWLINYKSAGLYYSDGVTWSYEGDYALTDQASEIEFTASGNITATNVQAAITQMDGIKAGIGFTTAVTAGSQLVGTLGTNGISLGVPAFLTTAGAGGVAISGGGNSQSTGTVNFANSNGITFGLSNNGTMTASHNGLTTARASTDGIGLNTAATNVTWTVNSSGISLNAGAYLTTAMQSNAVTLSNIRVSGGTTSNLLSAITFANGNGVSFGLNAGTMTASHNGITTGRASTDAVGLNTAQTNVTWTVNSNGLSLNAGGYAGTGTSATNASITMNSNGLAISVAAPGGGGAINVSAGTTSVNLQTLQFNDSNGVSFGLNGSTVTATVATTWAASNHSHGNPTLALTNLSGTTASASNGFTLSLRANIDNTVSTLIPYYPGSTATQTFGAMGVTSHSAFFAPVSIEHNVQFNELRMLEFFSFATSSVSGQQTISKTLGIFSNNAGTLSQLSSASFSIAVTNSSVSATISYPTATGTAGYTYGTTTGTGTAQLQSLVGTAGNRVVGYQFGDTMSLSEGMWYVGYIERVSSSSANIGISAAWAGNVMAAAQNVAPIGVATSAQTTNLAYHFGWGPYTSTGSAGYGGTALPSSVIMTGIANTMTIMPMMTFIST